MKWYSYCCRCVFNVRSLTSLYLYLLSNVKLLIKQNDNRLMNTYLTSSLRRNEDVKYLSFICDWLGSSNANEILATGIANPGLTCQNKFQNSSAPSSLSPGWLPNKLNLSIMSHQKVCSDVNFALNVMRIFCQDKKSNTKHSISRKYSVR